MTLASTPQQMVIEQRLYWGASGPTQRTGLNYTSPDSLTANALNSTTIQIPATTTGQAINFATLFPSLVLPLVQYLVEVTQPTPLGFLFYTHSGSSSGEKLPVGPNGYISWIGNGATAPGTVYVDNPGATPIVLEVGIGSN